MIETKRQRQRKREREREMERERGEATVEVCEQKKENKKAGQK